VLIKHIHVVTTVSFNQWFIEMITRRSRHGERMVHMNIFMEYLFIIGFFAFYSLSWITTVVPSPVLAASCISHLIGSNQTTLHLTEGPGKGTYHLETKLYGTYGDQRAFCGEMYATAQIITPPHGVDGALQVYVTNCRDTDLVESETYVYTGGLHGQNVVSPTPPISNSCGYAEASFQGSYYDPFTLIVHTQAVNGSGSKLWE
jgi:hypothetical protein